MLLGQERRFRPLPQQSQRLTHGGHAEPLEIRVHGSQRRIQVIHTGHVIEANHADILRNTQAMLMQRAHNANGLIVVRGNNCGGQRHTSATILVQQMIHMRICLIGIPSVTAHDLRVNRSGRGQLAPSVKASMGVTPLVRASEVQGGLMAVLPQQTHHLGHRTPLIDADHRRTAFVCSGNQAHPLAHGHLAVGGGHNHTRLVDARTAGGSEHHISRGQENEGVNVLLIEGVAQIVEVGLRAQRLMHHHHAHEQSMFAGDRFDGGNGGNQTKELQAASDQTDST